MGTTTPTDPDAFLVTSTDSTTWGINSQSGTAWSSIFADDTLGLRDVSAPGPQSVLIVSSDHFWGAQFSNSANLAIFGTTSPVVTNEQDLQGGVLGMITPPAAPLSNQIPFRDVLSKFGLPPDNSPSALNSFINAVDQSKSLALALNTLPTTRNALWAVPDDVYKVVVSLTFDIQEAGALSQIETFLNQQLGLKLSLSVINPQVVVTQITSYAPDASSSSSLVATSTSNMVIRVQIATFQISAVFTSTDMSVILSNLESAPSTQPIYQRLNNEVMSSASTGNPGSNDLPDNTKSSPFDQFLSGILLWYIAIGTSTTTGQSQSGQPQPATAGVFWRIGLLGTCNIGPNTNELLAAVTFDSRTSSISGKLLFSADVPSANTMRQYDYQSWTEIPTQLTAHLGSSLDITSLFNSGKPPVFPTEIDEGAIYYERRQSGDDYTFGILVDIGSGQIGTNSDPSKTPAPSGFKWTSINVNIVNQSDGSDSSTLIQILSNIQLNPPSSISPQPAPSDIPTIHVDLEYSSGPTGYWLLEGQAQNVPITNLSEYFDGTVKDQAIKSFGNVFLQSMDVIYTFEDSGDASSFLITAILVLGGLELDLYYQYATPSLNGQSAASLAWGSNPPSQVTTQSNSTWTFEAFLGATSPGATINSIITSISPTMKPLPNFVGGIGVNPASGGNSAAKLKLQGLGNGDVVLIIQVLLLDLDFTFVSLWPGSGSTNPASKTIFRISVDQIPLINSIPLIKELPQPFDQLLYLYLEDESGGLTSDELSAINGELSLLNIPQIDVKQNNDLSSSDIALQSNHHFMVVQKGTVILDHVFNNSTSQDPDEPAAAVSNLAVHQLDTSGEDPAPTKGNLDVQLPFLSISAVTLQFKQASLFIDIDATMMLGPISVSVIGFEIVLHLTKIELNNLADMLTKGFISFGIHGLSLSIDQSPLEISGVFIHDETTDPAGDQVERYMGGVGVGFEAWQFVAVGAYELITLGQTSYKSVFLYAKLNGPLVTLAFATISGVRVGFGYNSIVRSPTMAELPQFPFLDNPAEGVSGNDPVAILNSMTGGSGTPWVSPKQDSYWGAVGLTLTAFGILSITAVLMLGFHDSGVVITILADGIAQMPPDVEDPDETLFYVEIFMIAELNTVDGYFSVQASLAPSSHILVPSCRLTGGFALVNWFNPNIHSGDFVFTVGGFHPAYSPPSWYPVPARLGISFTLGSMINVTGYVYFAVTPKCVMGGGALHMGLDVGPVSAWLDVALDVFIQFKPFHYTADLSVSVGCAISINVWFVHVRISVSVGASLHIQGPDPFGGVANVDFYLFSFTINFGGMSNGPPPLLLEEFYEMVKTPGPAVANTSSSANEDPAMTQLKFVLTAGTYQPPLSPSPPTPPTPFPDSGANTVWNTKSGTFACTIGCDFALSGATLINDEATPTPSTTQILPPDGNAPPPFFSKPMHADVSSTIVSTMTVTVWSLQADGTKVNVINGFGGVMVMKDVPTALWGTYDPASDPAVTLNPAALTQPDQPTVQLYMGIGLTPPIPLLAQSIVQDFDATIAFGQSLGSWPLPELVPSQSILLAGGTVDINQSSEERWSQVAEDWATFSDSGAAILGGVVSDGIQSPGLLQMVAHSLGWDKPPPGGSSQTSGTGGSWILSGAPPTMLIDDLATQYPVLPRYSATTPS